MTLKRLIVDIEGLELSAEDTEVLMHPKVAGVILFSRNYSDPEQLTELTSAIHALRSPMLQISVDQEGGRVARFRSPFPTLPSSRELAVEYQRDASRGRQLVEGVGWIIGAQLRAMGVDLSFAPVLDLDYGISDVIGDRSYGSQPDVVAKLASSLMVGLQAWLLPAVGKHFPGHGAVTADSHFELPVDRRSLDELLANDLQPFTRLFKAGLNAVMTAHVSYPAVDSLPVTFSSVWIQDVLRRKLGFAGVVFSDDLSMHATAGLGDMRARYQQAVEVGCDRVLVCNDRAGVCSILDAPDVVVAPQFARAAPLNSHLVEHIGRQGATGGWNQLQKSEQWIEKVAYLKAWQEQASAYDHPVT